MLHVFRPDGPFIQETRTYWIQQNKFAFLRFFYFFFFSFPSVLLLMNTSTESCASLSKPSVIQAADVLISPRCSAKPVLTEPYGWIDISKVPAPEVPRPFPVSYNMTEEQLFMVVIWVTPVFAPRSWNVTLEQLLVSSSSLPGLISNHWLYSEVFPAVGGWKDLSHLKTTVLVILVTVCIIMISRWRFTIEKCIM